MSKYKPDDIITPKQASTESGIEYLTISRAVKIGKIPSKKEKNIISLVFKDFEKWWKEYIAEQDIRIEKINKSKSLLNKLSGIMDYPPCCPIQKYERAQTSEFLDKDFTYICKSVILKSNQIVALEILSIYKNLRPSKLTIKVTEKNSNIESFCEICNVHVLGDPQLLNFNGVTNASLRGISLIFSNELDISNWGIFGGSAGQGLILDVYNPHEKEIKIEILISGWTTKSEYLGQRVTDTNDNRLLFSKINCSANAITKLKLFAGRAGAFKINSLQMNCNENNNLEIVDISILKKQQIDYLNEFSSLSTSYFSKFRPIKFDIFGSSEHKGLEISFKNNNSFDIVNYITLLGENCSEDLIGQK
jgi:hypothetical protein